VQNTVYCGNDVICYGGDYVSVYYDVTVYYYANRVVILDVTSPQSVYITQQTLPSPSKDSNQQS